MSKRWEIATGVVGGAIVYKLIDIIVYAWTGDAEGMDCFKKGFNEGRYFYNLFTLSNGEMGNPDFLKPTNDTDLNNCQMAFQHGYALGVTREVAQVGVSASVGFLAARAVSGRQAGHSHA